MYCFNMLEAAATDSFSSGAGIREEESQCVVLNLLLLIFALSHNYVFGCCTLNVK